MRGPKPRENEPVLSRLKAGENYATVARAVGLSRQRIHQIAVRAGIAEEVGQRERQRRFEMRQAGKPPPKTETEKQRARHGRAARIHGVPLCDYERMSAAGAVNAYIRQRAQAAQRGIEWRFTLASWWAVWEASGKWAERGRASLNYVMARNGDVGPYSPENVRIATFRENAQEAAALRLQLYGNCFIIPPTAEPQA